MTTQTPLFNRYGFDADWNILNIVLAHIKRSFDTKESQLRVCYAKNPLFTIGGVNSFFVVQDIGNDSKFAIAIDAPGTPVHMTLADLHNEPNEKSDWLGISNERLPFIANDPVISTSQRRFLVHEENLANKYGYRIYRHFGISMKKSECNESFVALIPFYIDGCVPYSRIRNFGYPSYEIAVMVANTALNSNVFWNPTMTDRFIRPSKIFVMKSVVEPEYYALASANFGAQYFLNFISEAGVMENDHSSFVYTGNANHIDRTTLLDKGDAMLKFGDYIIESIIDKNGEHIVGSLSDFEEIYGPEIFRDMRKFFAIDLKHIEEFRRLQKERETNASNTTD